MTDTPKPVGVGSPAILHLHEFGKLIQKVFGEYPVLVGSALKHKNPRDIDVRVLLTDLSKSLMLSDPRLLTDMYKPGSPWAVVCMAFSSLGHNLTKQNIDFQVQLESLWNKYADEPRLILGKE